MAPHMAYCYRPRCEHQNGACAAPEICILGCDSLSYPPEDEEYEQCGCSNCIAELVKRTTRREGAKP